MIINQDAVVGLTTGTAEDVRVEVGSDGRRAVVVTGRGGPPEIFRGARVELHETEAKGERAGAQAWLTVTVPLRDDEARRAAYRLRDEARKPRKVVPT